MSMRTSIVYGYGFEIGNVDEQVLCNFVNKHAATLVKRNEEIELELLERCNNEDYEGIEEDFEQISCDVSGWKSVYSIISNIIGEETDVRFQFEYGDEGCSSEPSILFCEGYPWQMNETERNLTEEQMKEIVHKYVDDLGVSTTTGYIEVEYYG